MSGQTHTKGPWQFRLYAQDAEDIAKLAKLGMSPTRLLDNAGGTAVMADDTRIAVVDCQSTFKRGEGWKAECAERDANARLIAAAPDLLAALEKLAAYGDPTKDATAEICWEDVEQARAALAKAKGE